MVITETITQRGIDSGASTLPVLEAVDALLRLCADENDDCRGCYSKNHCRKLYDGLVNSCKNIKSVSGRND